MGKARSHESCVSMGNGHDAAKDKQPRELCLYGHDAVLEQLAIQLDRLYRQHGLTTAT